MRGSNDSGRMVQSHNILILLLLPGQLVLTWYLATMLWQQAEWVGLEDRHIYVKCTLDSTIYEEKNIILISINSPLVTLIGFDSRHHHHKLLKPTSVPDGQKVKLTT